MSSDAFLELRRIRKEFGAFTALHEIDLGIRKGEFVCFLGPSGCGKTTLLRIIAGLEVQTSGEVWQGGRDISRLPPAQRDYGIVFQSYALFRALATSPGLLLLDEPLSALDALERVRLRQEIRALQQKVGVTTIMVTHDQEEALSVADRIVVMNHGVIEQVGTPMDIYREPASPFVADYVGKVNVLPARVAAGELRFGSLCIPCEGADREARVYLRPEDVLARPIQDSDAHVFDASIEKIECLGSYCHVRVASPALDSHKLTVYLSLNYLSEQSLEVGSPLRLKLLPERIKVF